MWNSPYAKYLLNVEKPGRYVGGEFGCARPKQADVSVALAFPDAYEIGMSHIGLSILYEIVNSKEHLAAERVFMPWPDMVQIIKENDLPLVSLETGTELNHFDVVGFSLQYELTFTNVVAMLDMGNIPRHAKDRAQNDAFVVVGGPVAVEAEPMAPFVDVVLLGDGEDALPTLMEKVGDGKNKNLSRLEILKTLDDLPFAFAPNLHQRKIDLASEREVVQQIKPSAKPAVVQSLEDYPSGNGPVPTIQAVFDRYSVEIARGCTEGCRFCQAGYLYRPVRERSEKAIDGILKKATCLLGFDEVSLSSLSSADHSELEQIMTGLGNEYMKKRVSFSVPSLRAYGLSDEVIEVLSKLRASGVTLAPEAGSQRLRDLVNKNVSEEDVLAAAARFYERGFNRIKLYFMLGLPTETDEDLTEIVELALKIRRLGQQKAGRRAEVVISVSTFVPKPFTPFEREKMIDETEIKRRQQLLHDLAWANRVKLKTHHAGMSVLEGIFARGDIRLSSLIEQAVDAGAIFDGWDEMFKPEIWEPLLAGIDKNAYLKKIDDTALVPWGHIDSGVSLAFRQQERDAAYDEKTTPPCGVFEGEPESSFICHHCGIRCKRSSLKVKPLRKEVLLTEEEEPKVRSKGRPKPAPVIQAGAVSVRYRLEVAFFGRQVFVGHLDRMRHLMRSLTRAGLKLWYTQGFHPKPKIEAPPPVPLGTAALAEPFDVWLVDAPSENEILERLRLALPSDLEVRSVRGVDSKTKKLSTSFDAVEYISFVKEETSVVSEALKELMKMDKLEVMRSRKGTTKAVEIRQYVLAADVLDNVALEMALPDWSDRTAISMTLALCGSGGTRPTELLDALLPDLTDTWVVRTKWIKGDAKK